jgi:hypothetical protein
MLLSNPNIKHYGVRIIAGASVFAVVVLLGISSTASASVTANPASITLNTPDQKETVQLTHEGKPVAASAIKGHAFIVQKDDKNSDYKHMIRVDKKDGAVTISPSKTAEVGTYNLVIHTSHGDAAIAVNMPLKALESDVAKQAQATGIPEEELKARAGVGFRIGREKIMFTVPTYYVGDAFSLKTPCPADRNYEWRVNDMLAQQGRGPEPFSYVFQKAGTYIIEYIEFKEGRVVMKGAVTAEVHPKPVAGQ